MLRKERDYPIYKAWRTAVFERDGYQCRKCGEDKNLNAHHVRPFKNNPAARFDLSNGITLCEECHNQEHFGGQKNERIPITLQHNQQKRHYQNKPRTIWKNNYGP